MVRKDRKGREWEGEMVGGKVKTMGRKSGIEGGDRREGMADVGREEAKKARGRGGEGEKVSGRRRGASHLASSSSPRPTLHSRRCRM